MPRIVDKMIQHQAVQLEEPEQEEQQSKQLQHLRRLGKRHRTASAVLGTRRPINGV